jgi:hypothetical protein
LYRRTEAQRSQPSVSCRMRYCSSFL